MTTASLEATESECAEGRTAPRVSLDDIKAAIRSASYLTGSNAVGATDRITGTLGPNCHRTLGTLTICIVVMTNGFTIIGKSAPASPENFDPELGRKLAYEDAVRQIWPLMGFSLRDRLASGEQG